MILERRGGLADASMQRQRDPCWTQDHKPILIARGGPPPHCSAYGEVKADRQNHKQAGEQGGGRME